MTIRTRIALLVVACIVPASLLAAFITYLSYIQERSNISQRTLETARSLTLVVERDMAANMAALQALARSHHLERGDLGAFYAQAKEVLRYTSGFTIVVTDPSGQQVMNLLRPFGVPLPRHGNPEQLQRVLETRQAVVSGIYTGGVTQKPVVGIEVPVIRDGIARYGLALGIDPKHLGEILQRQGLSPDWVVSIFDGSGTIVARTHAAEQYIGHTGSPPLMAAMQQAGEGTLVAPTLEGISVIAAFSRSPAYGWSVAIGVPEAILTGDLEAVTHPLRRWRGPAAVDRPCTGGDDRPRHRPADPGIGHAGAGHRRGQIGVDSAA